MEKHVVALQGSGKTVPMYYIRSSGDIQELYNECMNTENECIELLIAECYNPTEFVNAGFLPQKIDISNIGDAMVAHMYGMSLDVVNYVYGNTYSDFFTPHEYEYPILWNFCRLSYYEREGKEMGGSIGLILYGPDLLYRSLRPITDMSMFRGPNNRSISRHQIKDGTIILDGEIWNVLPVTRYSKGMSRGLFFDESDEKKYCGTFFYFEPESKTFLAYKTEHKYFNKTDAMDHLAPNYIYPENYLKDDEWDVIKNAEKVLRQQMAGILPEDLRMTPKEWELYFEKNNPNVTISGSISSTNTLESAPSTNDQFYIANPQAKRSVNLYSMEDIYDQPICEAAQKLNIDIIILTHMVGSHQVVTEILDTRNRSDVFKSLVYITD